MERGKACIAIHRVHVRPSSEKSRPFSVTHQILMSTGKQRCRTISLALMAVIHPWNNAVYLTTNLITSHPQAISALEWACFMLTHPLIPNSVALDSFVSLAPGSSICSAQVGLFRKRMAEQCALENDRRVNSGLKQGRCCVAYFQP